MQDAANVTKSRWKIYLYIKANISVYKVTIDSPKNGSIKTGFKHRHIV